MSWIGLRDAQTSWFRPERAVAGCAGGGLTRGALVLETRLSETTRPQTLLAVSRAGLYPGRFSVQALPRGGIVLVDARGEDVRHATVPFISDGRLDVLRLTYAWDCAQQTARLTLERPETDLVQSVFLDNPLPLPIDAIEAAIYQTRDTVIDESVVFLSFSNALQPVGPMPALTAKVPVETAQGVRLASDLARGDLVRTDTGALVPVLQVVKRTVPARGGFRPVRLRAPFFGLSRDIVVAPHARLIMSGSQVEYMFGREAVLVPAAHLVNERSAFRARGPDLVTYYHVLLAGHEAIMSGACPLESLYVGRLRRKPDALAASVLARFDRARLPEHAKPVHPVLKPFEAVTLALTRAA
ncbi:MAG: Hint domain-containing protein [Pseudomonadota bacterium]